MNKSVIVFFCGTLYETSTDASFQYIKNSIDEGTTLKGYNGCHRFGGGLFSYGIEEQADSCFNDLKKHPYSDKIQLNIIAHSRGALSAFILIKKIQSDLDLKNKIEITADLRDPVPGNLHLTTKLFGNLVSANLYHDLSTCSVLKQVFITLQEKPFFSLAFDALVPKFHIKTAIEIEVLPGCHDAQQRNWLVPGIDHPSLIQLGNYKSLSILKNDGHQLSASFDKINLKSMQIKAYTQMIDWVKNRKLSFCERKLHLTGQTIANNAVQSDLEVINWRHASLKKQMPNYVLFGITHPNYNKCKNNLEYYCDLTIAVDKFFQTNTEYLTKKEKIKKKARALLTKLNSNSPLNSHYHYQLEIKKIFGAEAFYTNHTDLLEHSNFFNCL